MLRGLVAALVSASFVVTPALAAPPKKADPPKWDVNARHAYREAPPSIALIVDPTPNREIDHALGTGEMSDDEIAGMASGQLDARGGVTMPEQMTSQALQGSMGRLTGGSSVFSGSGFSRSVGGATGAVTGATRGIGSTVTGALSQFPLGGNQGTGP